MPGKGVVLIHGFAGGRYEVRPLGEYLTERGYDVAMPLLKGHEESRAALGAARYEDWIASGVEAYRAMAERYEAIAVIGFSMGGLIAVQMYQKRPFSKLVTINAPVYLGDVRRAAINLLGDFRAHARRYLDGGAKTPAPAVAQFLRLHRATKPLFSSVRCPCLIVQAQDDDAVHRLSANFIYDSVCGEKQIMRVPTGGHQVLMTESLGRIAPCVAEFLGR